MAQRIVARDCIDSTIPVFAVARIIKQKQMQHVFGANTLSPEQPFLTSRDISSLAPRTTTPIPDYLLYVWPFLDCTLDQIIDFAIVEFNGSDISPNQSDHSGRAHQ
ncbi:hypothetical protein D6D13_09730 [Aureobasidium pullulans]|uniref:Uncharacterized protein n=1 Tax=Aureobasidium pullulans TaxID=5580 RepID=A0A4V6TB92_AURPU|nr:hypothetical protein D6D13_09730 [Aureobasidium pullulans]